MIRLDEIAAPGSADRRLLDQLDLTRLPRHVAIIMDGNGRWAAARSLARVEGHRAGIRAVRETIDVSARLGLEILTLYAFSTENWKRPRLEVMTLMGLLKQYIDLELDRFVEGNLRLRTIGRIGQLEASVQEKLARAERATAGCTGMLVQIALSYSGRQELTDACREAARLAGAGALEGQAVDEDWVAAHLATAGQPDPDLMIRTSGEQRISNFLLWQLAYAEIVFSPVLWPDFTAGELLRSLLEYQRRERRFGGLPAEEAALFSPPEVPHGPS